MPLAYVDEDFVKTEVAHKIHTVRHRGDNFFCESDRNLAQAIVAGLLKEKGWAVVTLPRIKVET